MTERDYDRMLAIVQETFADDAPDAKVRPVAANDNDKVWPLMPFPEGWTASP